MDTLLVFGASRGAGLALLELAKNYAVVGVSRSEFTAPPNIPARKADAMDAASLENIFREYPQSYVVCTIGGTPEHPHVDSEGIPNIIRCARQHGAKHFVLVSSLGAGDSRAYASERLLAAIGSVLEAKTRAEEFLRASGMPHTIIRPGRLLDGAPTQLASLSEDPSVHGELTRGELARLILEILPDASGKTFSAVGPATA